MCQYKLLTYLQLIVQPYQLVSSCRPCDYFTRTASNSHFSCNICSLCYCCARFVSLRSFQNALRNSKWRVCNLWLKLNLNPNHNPRQIAQRILQIAHSQISRKAISSHNTYYTCCFNISALLYIRCIGVA